MKAGKLREWLDLWTSADEDVWINGDSLVLEGCSDPTDYLKLGFQPDFDKQWRDLGETSDGYHTFNELYAHRAELFIALCRELFMTYKQRPNSHHYPWRSLYHSDGTAWKGWFLLGLGRWKGEQITYHLPLERWSDCAFAVEIECAPDFDGHTSADVLARLKTL